jgi:hypothetical protein
VYFPAGHLTQTLSSSLFFFNLVPAPQELHEIPSLEYFPRPQTAQDFKPLFGAISFLGQLKQVGNKL